jgi:hypothetical protein
MFGRRKDDDDPFAALKDGVTYKSEPTTVAGLGSTDLAPDPLNPLTAPADPGTANRGPANPLTASPAPASPGPANPLTASPGPAFAYGAVRRTKRSSHSGTGLSTVIRLGVVAVVLAAIAIPIISANKAVHSITVPSFNFGSTTSPSTSAAPGAPKEVTYLSPAGVRAGLVHLRKVAPGARVSLLRIDSKSFNAIVVRPHQGAREIYFGPGVTLTTSAPAVSERPIPLSAVTPNVVGRLIAEMRSRFHVPPGRIDYMVISSPPGLPTQWIVFTKAPSHPGYGATLGGGGLHKL